MSDEQCITQNKTSVLESTQTPSDKEIESEPSKIRLINRIKKINDVRTFRYRENIQPHLNKGRD